MIYEDLAYPKNLMDGGTLVSSLLSSELKALILPMPLRPLSVHLDLLLGSFWSSKTKNGGPLRFSKRIPNLGKKDEGSPSL